MFPDERECNKAQSILSRLRDGAVKRQQFARENNLLDLHEDATTEAAALTVALTLIEERLKSFKPVAAR